jgi:galactose mutarotase-like enzyme
MYKIVVFFTLFFTFSHVWPQLIVKNHSGNVSAASFTDRTPYPKDLQTAYKSVFSMQRLPDGQFNFNNKNHQLDHNNLHPFIRAGHNQ